MAAPIKPSRPAESGDCSATSFHAGPGEVFLQRSYTVYHITPETATELSILEIDLQRNTLAAGLLLDIQISWFPFVCTSFTAS